MQNVILDIAKHAIQDGFNHTSTIDRKALLELYPEFAKPKATFVTLKLDNQLRGCIGSLIAHRAFLDDLIHNAQAAAFEDPRFYELTFEEFEKVKIEISILTTPVEIKYTDIDDLKSKIKPNVHGVIIQKDGRRSTFLPQVWEQLPTFEEFFSHLCHKGNFEVNCLEFHPQIFTYEVKKIK